MTAAIPPACCAGADDGKTYALLFRLGVPCGGSFAGIDSGDDHSGIGAEPVADATFAKPVAFPKSVAQPISIAQPIPLSESNADSDADANRFEFQRGIGQ